MEKTYNDLTPIVIFGLFFLAIFATSINQMNYLPESEVRQNALLLFKQSYPEREIKNIQFQAEEDGFEYMIVTGNMTVFEINCSYFGRCEIDD